MSRVWINRLFVLVVQTALSLSIGNVVVGIPVPEEFFPLQNIDHLDPDEKGLWTQRYYTYGKHFKGPGHPIFLILGGEGAISPQTGIFYPFVADHLAKTFGGFVLQPEHRFYGKSQPLQGRKNIHSDNINAQEDPRVKLFTSEQALHDAMVLLDSVRADLGCSPKSNQTAATSGTTDQRSSLYCPVVTVGGSYPGFLSAFARMLFPDIVDMAYAASAPMGFYAQETDRFAYYDHITVVAEDILPGCAKAVNSSLLKVRDRIRQTQSFKELESVATEVGICEGSIPDYIFEKGDTQESNLNGDDFETAAMENELMMVVAYTFANDNMASYPPDKDSRLYAACEIFSSETLSPTEKVKSYLTQRLHSSKSTSPLRKSQSNCWKMTDQLPTGSNATISGGDWSGDGTGPNGESWDFQTCTLLVEAIGFSEENSMFPARDWTIEWMREHCWKRFGVVPRPFELVRRFRFGADDLASTNITRILFTNGLKVSSDFKKEGNNIVIKATAHKRYFDCTKSLGWLVRWWNPI